MNKNGYKIFLRQKTKNNGDYLLDSSISRYCEFIDFYEKKLEILNGKELVNFMNEQIKYRQSKVLYSAFNNYLLYRGYDKDDELFSLLKPPRKRANSQTSTRYLQSKILSIQEIKILLENTSGIMKLIVAFSFDTAVRRDELINIKWNDIVLFEDDDIHGEVNIRSGKGHKSRKVYITKGTKELLLDYKNKYDFEDNDYVFRFYANQEKRINPYKNQDAKLYKEIRKIGRKYLNREISPHCLRHSKAQQMADNGADMLGISSYLGHSDVKVTEIYVKNSSAVSKKTFTNFSIDVIGDVL